MLEVIAHVIAAERQHCHRVTTDDADRSACRRRGFGRHNGADENAVRPVSGFVHQRCGLGSSATENDCIERDALRIFEFVGNAGAVLRGSRETGVGVCALHAVCSVLFRPGIALPVDGVLRRILVETFPPNGVVFEIVHDVGENGALSRRGKRVGIGLRVGAGRDSEETVFRVDGIKSAVLAYSYPRDVVADRMNLVALVSEFLGRNEHGKVGFAARGGECRRDIFGFAVGFFQTENEHVFRKPALVSALIGSDTESKALFAEKHVSAVTGVDGHNGVVFGELADVSLFFVDVRFCVEAAHEIVTVAQRFENFAADAGHDCHIENDVNAVGQFDTDFGERRTDCAHGERNDVHSPALHCALVDTFEKFVRLVLLHPIVGGTCVFFLLGADESATLDARDVVDGGAMEIATGQQLLIELNHFTGSHRLFSEGFELLFGTVDENDLVGRAKRDAVVHELLNSFVVKFHDYLRMRTVSAKCNFTFRGKPLQSVAAFRGSASTPSRHRKTIADGLGHTRVLPCAALFINNTTKAIMCQPKKVPITLP